MNAAFKLFPYVKSASKVQIEIFIIIAGAVAVYLFAAEHDILEKIWVFTQKYEHWEIDELIPVSLFLMVSLGIFSARRWAEASRAHKKVSVLNADLKRALDEIHQLKGIVPICSSCKRIRDDGGFWHQVELYIASHSDLAFSHSICPECTKTLYPEIFERNQKKQNDKK